jgi:hypothetical protein
MNSFSTVFLISVLHSGHLSWTFLLDHFFLLREVSFAAFLGEISFAAFLREVSLAASLREASFGLCAFLVELFSSFLVEFTADSLSFALVVALFVIFRVAVFIGELAVLQNVFG